MPLDDHALLNGVDRGDVDALGQFRERHAQRVYRAALGVLRDVQLAEEVAQDTFVSLWLGPPSYDAARGAPLPWLLSVARHRATTVGASNSVGPAAARIQSNGLRLWSLPGTSRRPTQAEVALHLGVPVCTVKGRVRLGLTRLRSAPS